ncbi:MAG: hypothetical protein AB1728_03515 [Bacteroidota bacterium]
MIESAFGTKQFAFSAVELSSAVHAEIPVMVDRLLNVNFNLLHGSQQ